MNKEPLETHKTHELHELFRAYGGQSLIVTNRKYYYDEPIEIRIMDKSADGHYYKIYENPDDDLVRVNNVRWVANNIPFKLLSDNV